MYFPPSFFFSLSFFLTLHNDASSLFSNQASSFFSAITPTTYSSWNRGTLRKKPRKIELKPKKNPNPNRQATHRFKTEIQTDSTPNSDRFNTETQTESTPNSTDSTPNLTPIQQWNSDRFNTETQTNTNSNPKLKSIQPETQTTPPPPPATQNTNKPLVTRSP